MARFSRVDGQGVGLNELRLTRELSLRGKPGFTLRTVS